MTSMTMLACSSCWNPIGAGARPLRLAGLAFHELCAPRCRDCGSTLSRNDETEMVSALPRAWGDSDRASSAAELRCHACRENARTRR